MSGKLYKRDVPVAITAILALILSVEYFTTIEAFTKLRSVIVDYSIIISAIGIYYGVTFLLRSNAIALIQRKETWKESLVLVGGFLLVLIVGLTSGMNSDNYNYIIQHTIAVSSPSLNAVSFFALVMAAYRSFKLKGWEPVIMMVSGVIVLLRVLPLGTAIFPPLAGIGDWITLVPNKGAARGAILCGALGAIIMTIRAFMGKERSLTGS